MKCVVFLNWQRKFIHAAPASFDMDALIIFNDILIPFEGMGHSVEYQRADP